MDENSTAMSVGVVHPLSSAVYLRICEVAPPLLILEVSVLAYVAVRALVLAAVESSPVTSLGIESVALMAAFALAAHRYADIPISLHILVRGIAIVVQAQVAFYTSTLIYAPTVMLSGTTGLFFRLGATVGVLAGICAMAR